MFSKKRDKNAAGDGGASQPLLNGSHEDLTGGDSEDPNAHLLFAASDDEDSEGHSDRSVTPCRVEHTVRFREEVQVIGPPLRSTTQSRETGACSYRHSSTRFRNESGIEYELDSDDFDDTALGRHRTSTTKNARDVGDRATGTTTPAIACGSHGLLGLTKDSRNNHTNV
ncbi:hypothetical protein J3R83DRAFT_4215 [Lanmaoa asiatica]|nr:hypothetical protein J3R83DRAFT_4215 [Lanmaoa asiatica]